jgi:hypothetical protein
MIYRLLKPLAVMLLVLLMATPAMAGTQTITSFVDSGSNASVPVDDHLMATIGSSADKGGNDSTAVTVSITGTSTIALADIKDVAVFYGGALAGRNSALTGLTNQVIDISGTNTKGGSDYTIFISLDPSAGGKTFGITVESITGATFTGVLPDNTGDYTATGAAAPEMNVYYQSTPAGDVPDDDTTPSVAEGTEFGNSPTGVSVDRTFTIQNTGDADLNLTDASPYVTVTGADFQLITPYPSTPVASGGGTTTFTVRFTPGSEGLKTGTVSIANSDSDENPYNFDIQGTGTPPAPEMNVYYLSTPSGDVPDNDTTPTAAKGTEFGNSPTGVSVDHTFTIQNTGTLDLNLTDASPYVTVTGADFQLITPYPSTPVSSGGGTTTFTVRFTPGSTGLKTGTVSIANDDSDENPYNFDIQGTGTAPEMNVYYQSTPSGDIPDNDTTPTAAEGTDFGTTGVATNVDHTFTIQNTGTGNLNLTDTSPYVTVTGADFTLITPYPTTPVASGGGTTTFTVRFTPGTAGLKTGTVSIANDDSDENPYNFDIQGTGTASPPVVGSPSATSIEDTTATLGGTVTTINATNIVERGIYWSTATGFTPPLEGTKVSTTGSWTGTPMPFIQNVINLPNGQMVYFQAFAVNDLGGVGYTTEASFLTEPSGQPSNLQFTSVGFTKMWISWDAGSGDGALVVMYDASPTPGDPVDGTVYTASTDFSSPGDPIANGYVVYSGPANSVFINGLTGNTTYYVKIYEYSGSGSGTNYQQTGPLTGSQATTATAAGHNDANDITNCDTCHALHTGTNGIVPRGAAQEIVCKTCHNATEMPGLPEKYEVGMHEVTKGGPKTIDCGSCHEVHNGYDFNTVDTHQDGVTAPNLSRIRQDTNKYSIEDGTWGPALEPAIFQTDPEHFAFAETTGSQSGEPWNGICQSCHTNASMKWHTNSNQASEANPHDHNKGAAPDNPDCMACHSHSEGFPTPTCQSCHSGPQDNGDGAPAGGRRAVWGEFSQTSHHTVNAIAETGEDCLVCHDQTTHMDGKVDLINADTGTLIVESASGRFRKANLIETDINNMNTFCQSCHDSDGATRLVGSESDPFGDGSTGPPEMSLHSNIDFPADRREPEFQVGCIQCHEGHGSTNLSNIDDTSVLINNSVGLSSPGTTRGPVVFTATVDADSYDEIDTENTDDADDICATCHINTMTDHTGGDHTNGTQGTDERGKSCSSCHPHFQTSITTKKGFMPPAGGAATCNTCHATGGTGVGGANNRRAIFGTGGDFSRTSHHATDGVTEDPENDVTENDCKVCHQEPDTNHQNSQIDLKMADGGTYVVTTFDAAGIQNNICLPCHDLNGASVTWNQTEGTSAVRPFSNNTKDVPNANDQFDTGNNAFHPVRGGTGTPSTGITTTTMISPWDTNLGTQTMTCFDCHDSNAHGSDYQKMIKVEDPASPGTYYGIDFNWYETNWWDGINNDLSKATPPAPGDGAPATMDTYPERIEVFCTKCHNPNVYVTGTTNQASVMEKHGANQQQHSAAGGNQLACMGCHGGFIDQNGGVVADNGAWNGNIHGVAWDWETDGGLTFGSKNWPGTPPADSVANNFMIGGWLSGWSAAGECGGGNCNHGGDASKGGGQSYTPAID